jgi:hypothetical protein
MHFQKLKMHFQNLGNPFPKIENPFAKFLEMHFQKFKIHLQKLKIISEIHGNAFAKFMIFFTVKHFLNAFPKPQNQNAFFFSRIPYPNISNFEDHTENFYSDKTVNFYNMGFSGNIFCHI